MLNWEAHAEDAKAAEIWENNPAYASPLMTHAAHPITRETPPGNDGSVSWLKYSDVEEWRGLTKAEARRRGPAIAACLSGRAELVKERLDSDRLKDPETGIEYYLATMRPFFAKDNQAVFLLQMRCIRGQMDYQRWLIKYEIGWILQCQDAQQTMQM